MRVGARNLFAVAVAAFVLANAGCDNVRAEQLLHSATALGAQGKWSEALHYYERLWVQYPESDLVDEARLKAARIYAGPEAKPRSAEDVYRQVILEGKDEAIRVQALLELAELYSGVMNNADRAIEVLEVYLKRYPGHTDQPTVALRLARLYLERGRLYQAREEAWPFAESVDRNIRLQALSILAQASEFGGVPEDAVIYYNRVLDDAKPGSSSWVAAMEGLARIQDDSGRWREALDTIKELREYHPNPDAVERWVVAIKERHTEMNR